MKCEGDNEVHSKVEKELCDASLALFCSVDGGGRWRTLDVKGEG